LHPPATPGSAPIAPVAAYIPMDGYHYSRAYLSAMENPAEAHARRGAEFTFDGSSFLSLVQEIRSQTPTSAVLFAPSFDHALKDPKADDIPILPTVQVLIFEGLYLSLDRSPWKEAAELMDELWFVEVDRDTARARLVERHVRTGISERWVICVILFELRCLFLGLCCFLIQRAKADNEFRIVCRRQRREQTRTIW
jgi:pantothenate kinase